jgi:hypothetical protein
MIEKTCNKCGASKPETEFKRRSEGTARENACKSCVLIQRRARESDPVAKERVALLSEQWRARNPDKVREAYKKCKRTTKSDERNPMKRKARQDLRNAIAAGRVFRPSCCSDCMSSDRQIQAHHPDYSKPFEVEWLCVKCHSKRHRKYSGIITSATSVSRKEPA